MTTNSPNPVDGDVQALIELAKRISNTPLKVISETVVCPGVYSSITSAEIHILAKVALSALKAEPCAYLYGASFERGEVEGEIEDSPGTDLPVYTTPPAQLLRPVELPNLLQPGADGYDDWYMHSSEDGEYMKADDVIAALEAAGVPYEVKS